MDIIALFFIGTLIGFYYKYEKRTKILLSILFLAMFYYVSIGLFLDIDMLYGLVDKPTNFMYSSGIFKVPFDSYEELCRKFNWYGLGIIMFIYYPYMLYIGIELGKEIESYKLWKTTR